MNILDKPLFNKIMYFKFFMVIVVWGLIPLFIPVETLPKVGLFFNSWQIILMRIWGIIVLIDSLVYFYIYNNRHRKLSRYLLLFGIIDNGGVGILNLILSITLKLPFVIYINVPFQLFFGYWFLKFYTEGNFKK